MFQAARLGTLAAGMLAMTVISSMADDIDGEGNLGTAAAVGAKDFRKSFDVLCGQNLCTKLFSATGIKNGGRVNYVTCFVSANVRVDYVVLFATKNENGVRLAQMTPQSVAGSLFYSTSEAIDGIFRKGERLRASVYSQEGPIQQFSCTVTGKAN